MEGNRAGRVERPKKYSQAWKSLARRIYVEEDTFSMLRRLKVDNGFSSDDATIRHLINGHQSLCLLKMLASSAEVTQLGGRSMTEAGNDNFEGIARNVPVASAENLLNGATENTETEQQSEELVSTRGSDLLFSVERSPGSQYGIASPSCFDFDVEMTATTSTPARSHKRPRLSRLARWCCMRLITQVCICNFGVIDCFFCAFSVITGCRTMFVIILVMGTLMK